MFFSIVLTIITVVMLTKIKNIIIFVKFAPLQPKSKTLILNDRRRQSHTFYRNCEKETIEPITGEILTGSVPDWLEGTLIRNGTGITKVGDDVYNHMFDGLALLHRYRISNGRVTYNNRLLESDTYKKNMAANRIVVSEFGTTGFPDPCKSLFQRLQSNFELTDNCSVNVGYYGDQLYAMSETNAIRRIDPETLETIGEKTHITKYVAINHATAHPHVMEDGTVYNVGSSYQFGKGSSYIVVKIPPTFGNKETCYEGAEIVVEIPFSRKRYPSYYHSFAITKDKIAFVESPLTVDLLKLAAMPFTRSTFATTMAWNPNLKTRFHVASLTDGKIHPVTYESDPFFASHHINAFEENGHIVVDVAAYDRGDMILALEGAKVNEKSNVVNEASARRFVLPLNIDNTTNDENLVKLENCKATATIREFSGTKPTIYLEPQHLTSDWLELPRINYQYNGRKYDYFYGVSSLYKKTWTSPEPDSLTKVDIKNNNTIRWSAPDEIPSEPVFVARPGATEEDDGIVLSALLNTKDENRVTLLMLNGTDMSEVARVRFQTESTVTGTFHGKWANQTDRIHFF